MTADEGFDVLWGIWLRRVARKAARVAWSKVPAKEYDAVFQAARAWCRVWARRGELEYVPHLATWLNGERWTDELPGSIGLSTVPDTSKPLPARADCEPPDEAVAAKIHQLADGLAAKWRVGKR